MFTILWKLFGKNVFNFKDLHDLYLEHIYKSLVEIRGHSSGEGREGIIELPKAGGGERRKKGVERDGTRD